jgi:Zinc knuckle
VSLAETSGGDTPMTEAPAEPRRKRVFSIGSCRNCGKHGHQRKNCPDLATTKTDEATS